LNIYIPFLVLLSALVAKNSTAKTQSRQAAQSFYLREFKCWW